MTPLEESQEKLRKFVSAALYDFLSYLSTYETSIIVGKQYPKDKLIEAFTKWRLARNLDTSVINKDTLNWLNTCATGFMGGLKKKTMLEEALEEEPENLKSQRGFYDEDEWKNPEDVPENWVEEGENWKDNDEQPA